MKERYILGISDSHIATACLLRNGNIVACASEERFTRVKNQPGVPKESINYCLRAAGIDPAQITQVVFVGKYPPPMYTEARPGTANNHPVIDHSSLSSRLYQTARNFHMFFLRQSLEYRYPFLQPINDGIYDLGVLLLANRFRRKRQAAISHLLDLPEERITFVDHHLCHAYAALYASPFPKRKQPALIFTADCQGDKLAATLSLYKDGKIKRIAQTPMTSSLGALYTEVTILLGMRPNDHEHKVMGLAPYAPPEAAHRVFDKLRQLIWLDKRTLTFKSKISSDNFSLALRELLRNTRFDAIAGGVQMLTEKLLTTWVQMVVRHFGIGTIVCGGGVFMNVKANNRILQLPEVKELFIMPSGGDESNAIGAAFWGYRKATQGKKLPHLLRDLYLGPEVTPREVQQVIHSRDRRKKFKITRPRNIESAIAELLHQGEIVGVARGKMEWGARALGARSILADPTREGVVDEINQMIKARDFWMPFAPVILDRWEARYIHNPKRSAAPYMILAFPATPLAQKHLKGAMHPRDKTLRPQVLRRSWNPSLYSLLDEFEKRTGRGGLLNTSFNIHGEPIVCTAEDAIDTFERSGLRYLALGDYLISKPEGNNHVTKSNLESKSDLVTQSNNSTIQQ